MAYKPPSSHLQAYSGIYHLVPMLKFKMEWVHPT